MGRHSSHITAYHPQHYPDKTTKSSFPSKYEPSEPTRAENKDVDSSVKSTGYASYDKAEIRTHSEYTNQSGKRCCFLTSLIFPTLNIYF